MDLASKLVVVIYDEDVGELTRHTIQCPEAIKSRRGSVVEMDRGELCDHECPSRAGRVLKDVRVRQWTFQGFGHFSGARDGKTAQGLQGLLRIHLVDYKGENASAETRPYPSRLDGIHLPEHPGDSVGRHGSDHCVSTGAGQTCDDAPHVGRMQVSQPFPSRLLLAGLDQIAYFPGDGRSHFKRDCLRLCSIPLSKVGVCSGMSRWSGIGHTSLHCIGSHRETVTQKVTNG